MKHISWLASSSGSGNGIERLRAVIARVAGLPEQPCRVIPIPERLLAYRFSVDLRNWCLRVTVPEFLAAQRIFRSLLLSCPEVVYCHVDHISGKAVHFRLMTVVFDESALRALIRQSLEWSGAPAAFELKPGNGRRWLCRSTVT